MMRYKTMVSYKNFKHFPAHIMKNWNKKVATRVCFYVDMDAGKRKITAWGELADWCCKNLEPGDAIEIITTTTTYLGKVFNRDTVMKNKSGVPVMVNKMSHTLKGIKICSGSIAGSVSGSGFGSGSGSGS